MSSSLSMPATGAIIQSVSQTRGAIGYVGLAYVSPRIKTLAISYDDKHFATPTLENAINKTYPIVRPLYYYYNKKNRTRQPLSCSSHCHPQVKKSLKEWIYSCK